MAPANRTNRNIDAVLAGLERQMTTLEEAQNNPPLDLARQMSDEDCLELALVYYEIAQANQMSYAQAFVRLLGMEPDAAEKLAEQLRPLAEQRHQERIRLHEGSL